MMEKIAIREFTDFIRTGKTPPSKEEKYFNGGIQWYTPGDLDKNKYLTKSQRTITALAIKDKKATIYPMDTLLVGCIGNIGKLGITTEDCASNQQITGIKPNKTTDVGYLYYWFKGNQKTIQHYSNNAVVPILNNRTLEKIKIPIPNFDIQIRIAKILSTADELKHKDNTLIAKYNELSQSLFLDMFGDPTVNRMGWDIKEFDYFAKIDTKMINDFVKYADSPHIGIGNIEKDTGVISNYKTVEEDNVVSGKYIFTPDHIIYSKIRPNLNKVALPTFHGLASADAYPILVNKKNANKYFFSQILKSSTFINYILKHSKRTNIPKANKTQMRAFKCIAPPIELQNKFAEHIQLIELQKQQAQASLKKSEELFNCLLQKAFKGELVT